MNAHNVWIGTGRITADLELKQTQNGHDVVNFTIAINKYVPKGQDKQANWIQCVAFGKTAAMICTWFNKGSRISIVGELDTFSYVKDGTKKYGWNVNVACVGFVDKKAEQGQQAENTDPAAAFDSSAFSEDTPF